MIPNNTGMLSRKGTTRDIYAQITYEAPVSVRCAVVDFEIIAKKTPVRSDSSASRGNAEEKVSVAKILFPPETVIGLEDKFEIGGVALRVMMLQPRWDIFGVLDHHEVDFEAWVR